MSWEQLQAIIEAQKEAAAEEQTKEVIACPLCNALLNVNDQGVKDCPMGHYRTS